MGHRNIRTPTGTGALVGFIQAGFENALVDAELFASVGAEALRRPGWLPNQIHRRLAEAGNAGEAVAHRIQNKSMGRAAGRGHRHVDLNALFGFEAGRVGVVKEFDAVDEAEIDDVDGNLRVVHILERGANVVGS